MPMADLGWDEDGMCDDHGAFACKRCALRSAEPKEPAEANGLVERLCEGVIFNGTHHDDDSIDLYDIDDANEVMREAADALAARDAEIEKLREAYKHLRQAIRDAGVKRTPGFYEAVMFADAAFLARQETSDDHA